MKRRIGVRLWPCYSETPPLSRLHKPAWLEMDCGLRAPDPDLLLRPLVLKHRRSKTNRHSFTRVSPRRRLRRARGLGSRLARDYVGRKYKRAAAVTAHTNCYLLHTSCTHYTRCRVNLLLAGETEGQSADCQLVLSGDKKLFNDFTAL